MKEDLFVKAFCDYAHCIDFAHRQKADAYSIMAYQLHSKRGELNKQDFMSYSNVFLKQAGETLLRQLLEDFIEELERRYV